MELQTTASGPHEVEQGGGKSVRVAIEANEKIDLKKLDVSMTLDELIESICYEYNINYEYGKYAIQWKNDKRSLEMKKLLGTNFVNEGNKQEIKDGDELKIVSSPSEIVRTLKAKLLNGDKDYNSKDVYMNAKDKTLLTEYKRQDLLALIVRLSCKLAQEDDDSAIFFYCLQTIRRALHEDLITDIPPVLVDRVVKILIVGKRNENSIDRSLTLAALKFIQELVVNRKFNSYDIKYKIHFIESLIPFFYNKKDVMIQESALRLVNYLLLNSVSEEEHSKLLVLVSSDSFKVNIKEKILTNTLSARLKHTLYVCQTLIMGKYWEKLITFMDENSDLVKQLKRTSADYHLHEIESDDNICVSTPNLTTITTDDDEGFFSNEKKTMKWNVFENVETAKKSTAFSRTFSKRSRSATRPSVKAMTRSDESIASTDMTLRRTNSDNPDSKQSKTLNRTSSFKGIFNFTKQINKAEEEREITPSSNKLLDGKYMTGMWFKFYGKVEKNTPKKNERFLYDTPKPPIRTSRPRRCHTRSESSTESAEVNFDTRIDSKPPIARKPSNINKKIENFRRIKSTDPVFDDKEYQISVLAYENIKYLADKERRLLKRCYLMERKNGQSFFTIANELTNIICDIMEVGKRPNMDVNRGTFIPLVFNTNTFMEDLFCETISLFRRTWKEMRGKVKSDYPKVLDVTRRQLQKSLQGQPATFQQLEDFLRATPYETIAVIRKNEAESQMKKDLEKKLAYLELRERMFPLILQVIKTQRIGFMVDGIIFPFYTVKGQKMKKSTRYLRLSKGHHTLHYGERNEETREFVNEKSAPVRQISEIISGKKCQHYKDLASFLNQERDIFFRPGVKQKLEEFEHPFSIIFQDETSFDVFASDEKNLDYWTDGVRLLKGKKMKSSTSKEEIKEFLDIEVRLQLLDVEGLTIPDTPPPVPPEPTDFNFCYPENKLPIEIC